MSKIGILAYGSLIEDSGVELEPLISEKISGIETPFNIEFARSSKSRNGAPTVVPVEVHGASVTAVILVLNENVGIEDAKNFLWRRETRNERTKKKYPNPTNPTLNQVVVETVSDLGGIETVLYTKIGANIDSPTPEKLAELAVKSTKLEAGSNGKDGISYLLSLKSQNITTPLTDEYEKKILELLNVTKLEDAHQAARQNI